MDREKLAAKIQDADIPLAVQQDLLARLKVASHVGCARVVREFEAAMVKRRCEVLQSHRRHYGGLAPAPSNKRMIITAIA